MTTAQRNRAIKSFLKNDLGFKNVSVTGTAYGWVRVCIVKERPVDCTCTPGSLYCSSCKAAFRDEREVEQKITNRFPNEIGTYLDDMGYDHSEIIVETRFN